ncbi:MAG: acyltransferase [Polyangiaceae bacterium]
MSELTSPQPARVRRLDGIDVLRGVASVMVVVFHAGMYWQSAMWTRWTPLLTAAEGSPVGWFLLLLARLGFLGVSLFLVLSGFCLHYPNAVRQRPVGSFRKFMIARGLRILPPYLVSMFVLWAIVSRGGVYARASFFPIQSWDVAVHALLLHNLHGDTIWSINGVYWSLALEWQLYWVFPLIALVIRRAGLGLTALFAGLLSVSFPLLVEHIVGADKLVLGWWGVVYESLPAHLFELTSGMLAAELLAREKLPPRWLLAVLSCLWLPVGWMVNEAQWFSTPFDRIVYGVSFGSLALLVGARDMGRSLPARAAMLPGVVSYSLYLVHQPILLAFRTNVVEQGWSAPQVWGFTVFVVVPALVALAWSFYELVERPFMRGNALRDWIDSKLT